LACIKPHPNHLWTHDVWVHSCNKNKKGGKKKPGKKIKKEKENINLILSHVNHAFLILESKPLDTLIVA
jgi:hypothetical protein